MQSVNQKMEIKARKVAIIAGDGDIPIQLIDECIKQKREFYLSNNIKFDICIDISFSTIPP